MAATISPAATTYGPGDDEAGLCHLWVDGGTVCGAPVAADSPGLHPGVTADGRCTGCWRPRCPDCVAAR